jgi:hypothetical protein
MSTTTTHQQADNSRMNDGAKFPEQMTRDHSYSSGCPEKLVRKGKPEGGIAHYRSPGGIIIKYHFNESGRLEEVPL